MPRSSGRALERRIDHRSLEEQRAEALAAGDLAAAAALDRIPTKHLGKANYTGGTFSPGMKIVVASNQRLNAIDERIAQLTRENVGLESAAPATP